MRLTIRRGPAMPSTTAATRGLYTMMMPGKRLRADWATIGRSVTPLRRSSSKRDTSHTPIQALTAFGALHPQTTLGLPTAR